MSTFSFHPVKHLTTAEGGMITTNDEKLYKRLLTLRTHGMHKEAALFKNRELAFDSNGEQNMWYYEMAEVGYNYRITDLQCALGLSQLTRNDNSIVKRRLIADEYNKAFKENELIRTPSEKPYVNHAYHLYTILIDFDSLRKTRNKAMKELKQLGVGTQVLYIPIHLQPFYANKYGSQFGDFPVSEDYYKHCLSIPMFQGLESNEVEYVIECIDKVLS